MTNDTYHIIKLNKVVSQKCESDYLVIITSPMSFFDTECMENDFRKLNYHGKVIFDYLLTLGNEKQSRIDIEYFSGDDFYPFILTKDYPDICKVTCTYLKEHPELMVDSALTDQEKDLIMKCYCII